MTITYLLAIDQGTTSSRAMVFDATGKVVCQHQKELRQIYPHNGWVEQDAQEIWNDTLKVTRAAIADVSEGRIARIGITNQRETTIVWDRKTGMPIYNAIVWQDRRTADYCAALKEEGHEDTIRAKTGLLLDPYFSATKLKWILDHVDGARAAAEHGDLAFGTVECWLLYNLTGGKVHASDATNAGRTMLYNIVEGRWDQELLDLFDIPTSLLPEVKDNVADFGVTDEDILGEALPIGAMAGDQHAAMIGQACFSAGMTKSTYGTGCFLLANIGETFKQSDNRLLTTMAYQLNGKPIYAIEGSVFIAGAAIQWLRDGLGILETAEESEYLARSIPDNGGVYFVPALTGLGAPYWNAEARGVISGLTRDTGRAHIVRAGLEAQAYQTVDLISAIEHDSGITISALRVDGGMTANEFVCQFLADMLDCTVECPESHETTALGAAYLAGLSAGLYGSLDDIAEVWHCARTYSSDMAATERSFHYDGWKKAVKRVML